MQYYGVVIFSVICIHRRIQFRNYAYDIDVNDSKPHKQTTMIWYFFGWPAFQIMQSTIDLKLIDQKVLLLTFFDIFFHCNKMHSYCTIGLGIFFKTCWYFIQRWRTASWTMFVKIIFWLIAPATSRVTPKLLHKWALMK